MLDRSGSGSAAFCTHNIDITVLLHCWSIVPIYSYVTSHGALRYAALSKADIPKTECLKDTIVTYPWENLCRNLRNSRLQYPNRWFGCSSVFKSMINLKSERKNLREFIAFQNSWCFCWHKTQARVMPFWEETIAPALKSGKTVFVAAHGNSIRAILKFLEGISDNDITGRMIGCLQKIFWCFLLVKSDWRFFGGLEIPTGRPLMYKLDKDPKMRTRATRMKMKAVHIYQILIISIESLKKTPDAV